MRSCTKGRCSVCGAATDLLLSPIGCALYHTWVRPCTINADTYFSFLRYPACYGTILSFSAWHTLRYPVIRTNTPCRRIEEREQKGKNAWSSPLFDSVQPSLRLGQGKAGRSRDRLLISLIPRLSPPPSMLFLDIPLLISDHMIIISAACYLFFLFKQIRLTYSYKSWKCFLLVKRKCIFSTAGALVVITV